MKKRITALALAFIMVMGTVALAASAEKTITVSPMTLNINGQEVVPTKSNGAAAEVFAYDGATYVPLRFLSELLGLQVEWDAAAPDVVKISGNVAASNTSMKPGSYEVSIFGHNATILMKVTMEEHRIAGIEVLQQAETQGIGDTAFTTLIPAIVEGQSLNVDMVTGATVTSTAIISGVTEAIRMAGGNPDDFQKTVKEDNTPGQTLEKKADVVVIGSGAAGIAAALEAKRAGASVLVLEKLPHVGGNTYICGGIVYGTGSKIQAKYGLEGDSVDALAKYWMDRAEGNANADLVRFVAEHSGETIDWMVENGVELGDNISSPGTAGVKRGIKTANGGVGFIIPLTNKAQEEGVEILLNTRATELITKDGVVCGVKAEAGNDTLNITAGAVVLASGGFDADYEVTKKYSPELASETSYASPGNTGDGIVMAQAVGADTVFKGGVIGFRAVPGVTYRDPINGLRTANCLSVTEKGVRYTNETIDYPIFYANMKKTGSDMFYSIFDSATANETMEKAVEGGFAYKADSLEELAALAGMPADALEASVKRYNELCAKGSDDDFGKAADKMVAIGKAPFYALKVVPATIGSMGGVKIDLQTQVLNTAGAAIPGLYAAGAVANGDFFYQTYPASGSAIQFGFTTGRVAGQQAAAYIK